MMEWIDPFALYDSPALMAKSWDVVSANAGGGTIVQSLTSGRFGGGGLTFTSGNGAAGGSYPLYTQKNYNAVGTPIVGMALRQNGTQNTLGGRWLTFLDSATTQIGVNIMPSGQLQIVRAITPESGVVLKGLDQGGNAQVTRLGTSAQAISSSSFDFLECKVIHGTGTSGSVVIMRNGAEFYTLEDVDTAISGNTRSASVLVGGYASVGIGAGSTTRHLEDLKATISDFHLLNTVASGSDLLAPVDFIGDRRWHVRLPTSDVLAEWTPNPVGTHAANVNTVPPNEARDNNTETVGARDTFLCESATGPDNASVILAYGMYLQKNAGGAVGVSGLFRLGGVDRNGSEFQVPNPYAWRWSFLSSKPGGGEITIADVNNVATGSHGYERTS